MALPWTTETTKKEAGQVLTWDEGTTDTKQFTLGEPLSKKQVDILHSVGIQTIGPAQPTIKTEDSWFKKIARAILPRNLEIRLGLTTPNEWETTMQLEDARLSYLREKKFLDLYKKEIKEAPQLPKDYKEPTSFTGQLLEGIESGYISSIKGGFGYFVESMGRQIGSPERLQWGADLGDRATIELLKRPELLEPEDLKPFLEGGLIDGRYYGRRIGQMLPFMASAISMATLGGLVGGPPGAFVGGFSVAAALEKGNAYKRYIDEGVPPDNADLYSNAYGAIAGIIENMFGVSPARMGTQISSMGVQKVVFNSYKSFLINEIPRISINTLKMAVAEGGEEVAQSITENLILKFYKTETPILSKDLSEEFFSGAIAAIPFGATNIRIPDIKKIDQAEIKNIEATIKKADEVLQVTTKPKAIPPKITIGKSYASPSEGATIFPVAFKDGSLTIHKFPNKVGISNVNVEKKGIGTGTEMMEETLQYIQNKYPNLPISVFPESARSRTFFEKLGFVGIGREMFYAKGRVVTETEEFPKTVYQKELLEEISNLETLPIIERDAFDWTPPKFTYNNPYTRVMYKAWDGIGKMMDSKAPAILKEAQTQEIAQLLKERQRVYDGLVKKYYGEIVKPLTKLTAEEKQNIGEMIFKRIDIPEDYAMTVKNIDSKIGQLGQAIVNIDMDLVRQGFLASPETAKRAKEIGQRLITLRRELNEALGKLKLSMRGQREVISLISHVERQMAALEDTFSSEYSAFMREGEIAEVTVPKRKRVGVIPDELMGLAQDVKRFKTFNKMMASKVGITVERLNITGKLQRLGFNSPSEFYNYVKEPYILKSEKQVEKELKGNVDKLVKTVSAREKFNLQREILRDIDVISTADSLRFLESIVNDMREERGALWEELRELRKELEKPLPLLTEEVWLSNLGEYARTLYVRVDDGKVKVTPRSTLNKDGVIDRSAFKRKLTNEDWGANALSFEGKTLAEIKEYSIEELREIGVEAKERFGWTLQADYILSRTFKDMAKVYASRLFQKAIIENPRLFTKDVKLAEEKGFIPIRDILPKGVDKDVRLGPLNDGYIHPGLQEELSTFILRTSKDSIMDIFQEPLSWWKAFKVAGNPPTVIRNFISGAFIQTDLAGYPLWTPTNSKNYLSAIKSYSTKDALYTKLRDGGQYGSDYFSIEIDEGEMDRIIAKAEKSNNPMGSYTEGILAAMGGKLKDAKQLFSYYGHIDHIQRTYLASSAMNDGASLAQAVHFANKWELDYRFVPKFVESLRSGLPGWLYPFLSFYTLMAPRIAEVLITRPWVLAKYPIIMGTFSAISLAILGADDDEVEAAKPEWLVDKDYVILLPTKDNDNNFVFLDLDYTLPFGGPTNLFMDFNQVLMMIKNPGMMNIIVNLLNNYDTYSERKIYNESDLAEDKTKKIAEYVIRNLGPGFVTHALNIYGASKGEITGYPIQKEKSLAQTIARTLGVSVYSGGFNEAFWKIRNIQQEISDMQWSINVLMSNPNISIEEKQRKTLEYQEEMRMRIKKIQELSMSMPQPTPSQGKTIKALEWE